MLNLIFFISGFCSLLYQVVWQRLFGLVCSSDNVTAALVVAAFLFGLGIGNYCAAGLAGRLSPKVAFRLLAVCETLITLFAFASPLIYYDVLFAFFLENTVSLPQTFVILFVSLLPSTFLMGMSMPLLGRAIVKEAENTASVLGSVYAANIVGAGTGAIVTSFWLLGTLGMEVALYFGGGLNLCIALGLWVIPHRHGAREKRGSTVDWKAWCALLFIEFILLFDPSLAFESGIFVHAFLPGFFMIACALSVSGWPSRPGLPWGILLAVLLIITLHFFTMYDGAPFLASSAVLAFAVLYTPAREQRVLRFVKAVLFVGAASAIASLHDNNGWAVFHYLMGSHWLGRIQNPKRTPRERHVSRAISSAGVR